MSSIRRALAAVGVAGFCAVTALAAPAVAVTSSTSTTSEQSAAGCYTRLYFNQNTYLRARPASGATYVGLAYANDTFDHSGQSQNGFLYGRDVRAGGATGWVPAANISSMRVCN